MVKSYSPTSFLDALQLKKAYKEALLYAGGTDLMVAKKTSEVMIFLNHIQSLKKIEVINDTLCIGPCETYRNLIAHPLIPDILKRAMKEIAAPSIRNSATIGGNICNASPAGDTLPILYLLDAVLLLSSVKGQLIVRRQVPIREFIQGIRKTTLEPTEILESIQIPLNRIGSGIRFGFQKVGARKAQAISKLLFTAALEVKEDVVTDFRVAYGSVGITVVRNEELESRYIGMPLARFKELIPAILQEYDQILHPIDDQRSTAKYRKKVCLNLLEDFLLNTYSRTIISNGSIIDGTGNPAFSGDILIQDRRILQIAEPGAFHQDLYPDARNIDATGLVVSPGFIDTHSHSDLKVLTQPEVLPKIMQGITTEVLGQDGISMAPLPIPYISAWRKNLAGLDGESSQISWFYENTQNYLAMIEEAGPSLNESYLLPHGNVRMEAMGLESKAPTPEQLHTMCQITRREMEAGCLGLSSGLIYMPCAYSNTQEMIALCKVVAEYQGVFVVHQRSEADTIIPSMQEIIQIGRESGVKIHFSHFKVCGKENWKYLDQMFELLDQAREEGIQISLDQYPYVAGSTMLGVILPPWVHDGGTDRLVERLGDEKLRKGIIHDIKNGIPGWDNFVAFAGTSGIYITSVNSAKNQNVIGLNLDQLGELWHKDPLEAAFDLLLEEKNAVGMVDFYGLEEHVIKILQRPEMNACTDGLLSGTPHPRVYGAFPRILGKYVREEKVLSLESAVHKLTQKAALAMGIPDRGTLVEGAYADIAIWNPDSIIDRGTFEQPTQYPEGIVHVMVNGVLVVEAGSYTGNRNGIVIRKS